MRVAHTPVYPLRVGRIVHLGRSLGNDHPSFGPGSAGPVLIPALVGIPVVIILS